MPDDAAKRAFDIVRQTVADNDFSTLLGYPFMALKLSDGSSDGKLYATKLEAVKHQFDELLCAYFCFRLAPHGFGSPKDAAIFLAFNRAAYDAGFRLPDPDDRHGGPDLIMPFSGEHLQNQLTRLANRRN